MPQSQATKKLRITYLSTMLILCFLLLFAQVLIQFALMKATDTENAYAILNTQQLRMQRIIRNALLVIGSPGDHQSTLLSLYTDDVQLELTQAGIDNGNPGLQIDPSQFPESVHARINTAHKEYGLMVAALHQLLVLAGQAHPDHQALLAQLSTIFFSGGVYASTLTSAAADLLNDSAAYVGRVRIIELALFVLCMVTLLLEYLLVYRPVWRQMQAYLQTLHMVIERQQEEHQTQEDPLDAEQEPPLPEEDGSTAEEISLIDEHQREMFRQWDEEHHPPQK